MHEGEDFMAVAREVGAIGYVFKPRLSADLVTAVREASAGRPFVSSRS
jgi:DNA-binding NarL/FixJ family response regulator